MLKAPTSSLWLYLGWWFGLSGAATLVLFAAARVTRRLLPLAALLKLSLVFPDETPSRLQTALRAGSVTTLEERLALVEQAKAARTPIESAQLLLELVSALDAHDRLTRGHSERVRGYAVLIGKQLGLRKRELDLLNWAALLHDVGKLEVAPEILTKSGRPTEEEWQVLRRHPLFGERLSAPLRAWLAEWHEAIGYHHERWDGKGYPRGLSGDEIPLAGRIVAVADVFDVITSARTYKDPDSSEAGRREIARCAGTQFDPHVVRAFLNVSLGRMRAIMGPLSWLSHAPLLGRLPLTQVVGTVAGTVSVVATAAASGALVHHVPTPASTPPARLAAVTQPAPHVNPSSPPPPRAGAPRAKPRPHPTPVLPPAHRRTFVSTPPAVQAIALVPEPTAPVAPPAPVATAPAEPTPAPPPSATTAEPAPAPTPAPAPAPDTPKPKPPAPRPPAPPAVTPPPTTTTAAPPVAPAPPPPHLVFAAPPSTLVSGVWTSIRVEVVDDANNVVTGDSTTEVTLDLTQRPAGGVLTCTNAGGRGPVQVQGGVVDFVCSIDRAGSGYVLTVEDSSSGSSHPYADAVTNTFAVTAGTPAQLVFSTDPTNTTSLAPISPAVRVSVEDAAGNAVTSDSSTTVTVAVGSNPGAGTLGGALTQTAQNGVATFSTLTLDKAAAGYTLTATSSPATSTATSTAFSVVPGAPAQLVFTGEPTNANAAAAIAPSVEVSVEDASGNVVTSDSSTTVTVAVGTNPGGGTLGGTLTRTVQNGIASFADLTLDEAATGYTLSATSNPATTTATSASFDIAVGPPAQVVFTGEPTNASTGSPIAPSIQVALEDAAGNVVDTDNTTAVTVAIGANPGGSTLGGTLTETAQNGVATFSDLALNNAGTGYTLTATSSPATTTVTSDPFDVGVSGLVGAKLLTTDADNPCKSGSSCTSGTFTATPGATLLILVQRADSTKTTDSVTAISGLPALSPAPVASVEYPVSAGRNYLFAWSATGTGVPGAVTVDFQPGSNANPTVVQVIELTGVNPLLPVVQAPTAANPTNNATATLAAPDSTNGEILMVTFRHNKPISPPLGFGTIDTFMTGSAGGDTYGVYFNQSAQASTTIVAPGGGGWGTIAIELQHS
ncbi:MAG TPA: HD domain-containing phosphohydrolase [Gaiellaceae bacterium]|nr:HD domain-containing phosphohydrolase [Gaiellaceae bacterium]